MYSVSAKMSARKGKTGIIEDKSVKNMKFRKHYKNFFAMSVRLNDGVNGTECHNLT
jgi:hypothetical protein